MNSVNTNDQLLSKTIIVLRFPLAVGIVFIHYNLVKNPFSIHGVEYGTDCAEWLKLFVTFLSNVLPRIGVPLFYFMSGFLFFYGKDFCKEVYAQKIRKRLSTLFVPYLMWNTIAVLLTLFYMLPIFSSVFPNLQLTEVHISLERILKTFFANYENEGIFVSPITSDIPDKYPWPTNVPLWYVRDLLVLMIFSPILHTAIRFTGKWFLFVLCALYFSYEVLVMPEGGWSVLMIRSTFFFSWGGYFSIHKKNFINSMRRYKYLSVLYIPVAVADTLTKTADYNLFIEQTGIIIGLVSAIIMASYLVESGKVRVNKTLANCSFFLYCLHTLILMEIGKVLFLVLRLDGSTMSIFFLYLFVPAITIMICVLLYIPIKKHMPIINKLLTGGR